jgi:hypothetical protein
MSWPSACFSPSPRKRPSFSSTARGVAVVLLILQVLLTIVAYVWALVAI